MYHINIVYCCSALHQTHLTWIHSTPPKKIRNWTVSMSGLAAGETTKLPATPLSRVARFFYTDSSRFSVQNEDCIYGLNRMRFELTTISFWINARTEKLSKIQSRQRQSDRVMVFECYSCKQVGVMWDLVRKISERGPGVNLQ